MTQNMTREEKNKELLKNIWQIFVGIIGTEEWNLKPYSAIKLIGALLYIKKNSINIVHDGEEPIIDDFFNRLNGVAQDNSVDEFVRSMLFCVRHSLFDFSDIAEKNTIETTLILLKELQLDNKDYIEIFDDFTERIQKQYGNELMFSKNPKEYAKLTNILIGDGQKSVYNPLCGLMDFATYLTNVSSFYGEENSRSIFGGGININEEDIIRIRLSLADVNNIDKGKVNEYNADVYVSAPKSDSYVDVYVSGNEKFRKVTKVNMDSYLEKSEINPMITFAESAKNNAVGVFFVPVYFLITDVENAYASHDTSEVRFREYLLKNNILDTVILLPKEITNSDLLQRACVILKKNRSTDESVMMVDASDALINEDSISRLDIESVIDAVNKEIDNVSKKVPVETILNEKLCIVDVKKHVKTENKDCPEGYTMYRLSELFDTIDREDYLDKFPARFLHPHNLSSSWSDCIIDDSSIGFEKIDFEDVTKLTRDAIVMSRIGKLRPSIICAAEDKPVYISSDIIPLVPKVDICGTFICKVISDNYADVINYSDVKVPIENILNLRIDLPDLQTQKALYQEARKTEALAKAREMGLQEEIERMKQDYINEVRMRKHDMRPFMRELGSIHRVMSAYIKESNDLDDLKEKLSLKMEQYESNLQKLSDLLEILSQENEFGEPESFNIDEYFCNMEKNHKDETYKMVYECSDIRSALTFMSPIDFERMVNNIVENAKAHGFTNPEKKDYLLSVELSFDSKRKMYCIDFRNNGTPFPKGMTTERYGILGEKAGTTARTGAGGHIVKSITKHYGGDYEILSSDGYSIVRVWLPINQ